MKSENGKQRHSTNIHEVIYISNSLTNYSLVHRSDTNMVFKAKCFTYRRRGRKTYIDLNYQFLYMNNRHIYTSENTVQDTKCNPIHQTHNNQRTILNIEYELNQVLFDSPLLFCLSLEGGLTS